MSIPSRHRQLVPTASYLVHISVTTMQSRFNPTRKGTYAIGSDIIDERPIGV